MTKNYGKTHKKANSKYERNRAIERYFMNNLVDQVIRSKLTEAQVRDIVATAHKDVVAYRRGPEPQQREKFVKLVMQSAQIDESKYSNALLKDRREAIRWRFDTAPTRLSDISDADMHSLRRNAHQMCDAAITTNYIEELFAWENVALEAFFARNAAGTIYSFVISHAYGLSNSSNNKYVKVDLICAHRGYGTTLLKNVLVYYKRIGFTHLIVDSIDQAESFYAKLGFFRIDPHRKYDETDEIPMVIQLSDFTGIACTRSPACLKELPEDYED